LQAPGHIHESNASKIESPKFRKVEQLMDYVESQFDVFDAYPDVHRFLDAAILSVSPDYRGYGIGGSLVNRTLEYMRENDIPLMHVLCTSHFSARLLEKMGFEVAYTLPYADYLVDGEQVLQPGAPHLATKILIKKI
jgi:arylalkylamine N-acetyltransferase